MRRGLAVVIVAALAVGLTTAAADAEAGKLPKVVKAYMTALALASPKGAATTVKLSAPGSNAEAYSRGVAGRVEANTDAGQPSRSSMPEFDDEHATVSLCGGTPRSCLVYSQFEVVSGKVADFRRDDIPFTGALSTGDGSSHDALGSTLSVVGAYQLVAGDLIVVVGVKNGPTRLSFSYKGTYVGPDGHRVRSTQTVTPGAHLKRGSSATLAFTFPGAAPGGSVIVKCTGQGRGKVAKTEMPVPVFRPA
jgi:hypothetical protein